MRYLAPLFCLALLSGCSSDLARLKEMNPPATDFKGALAAEYRDFADSEHEQGHVSSASHFAAKGLAAYHGSDVQPDALNTGITNGAQELADARSQLVRLLTQEVKDAAPQELARTQLLFDCWQQQVGAGTPPEKALCAPEFAPTLNQTLAKAGPEVYDEAFRRSITFAPNSTRLTDENKADITEVVRTLNDIGSKDYWVELRAYVGRKSSQRKLTEARIGAVKKMLVKDGVHARQIRIQREGAKGVMLSRDNIPMNTKVVTITITAEPLKKARKSKQG